MLNIMIIVHSEFLLIVLPQINFIGFVCFIMKQLLTSEALDMM